MKAVVFTLGCKVNECESDSLITGLKNRGYEVSDKLCRADLYIVNTCAVTAEAEKKSRQTVSRIKKFNENAKIIFTGCAAENNYGAFADKGKDILVTGVFDKMKILDALDRSGAYISPASDIYEELPFPSALKTRAFVKVQDGCNRFCSYCIIPYLRGRSRSRDPESAVREIVALKAKETVITGIDLSDYNYGGKGLDALISLIAKSGINTRIRLGSLEERAITDGFLSALCGLKNFAPHFHLSMQSGSNAVLLKMNRKYTIETFLEKVALIRRYFPLAGITTDVIAGFPTETDDDFKQTLVAIMAAKFSDIHAFSFSPRKGTAAYKMPDLPAEVKKERLDRLMLEKSRLKADFAGLMRGKTAEFLPEEYKNGYTDGYSENYLRLYVKGDLVGRDITRVKVIGAYKDGATAELI